FLEHGIDEARKVIHRLIDDTLAEVATEGPALDWKTSLTVKAHGLGKEEPVYHMEVSGPEYAQIFTARVSLGENGDIIGIGKGSSKRKAQLAAAEAGWKSLDSFKTRTK
ncbi:ribonuclease III, partial [Bifidobacterium longum]